MVTNVLEDPASSSRLETMGPMVLLTTIVITLPYVYKIFPHSAYLFYPEEGRDSWLISSDNIGITLTVWP
jgi:hypothetical protein